MIYVRLAGGLGNQLFQLAAALRIRGGNNSVPIVVLTDALTMYDIKRDPDIASLIEFSRLHGECRLARNAFERLFILGRFGRVL